MNEQIKTEIRQYMEKNENNSTMPQLLWDTAKAVLRGKHVAIKVYHKKDQSQMNSQNLQLMKLEK